MTRATKTIVSELAESVKALKAANTIEATPQRTERKQAAAEEPITARIRRRFEIHPSALHADEQDAATDTQHLQAENSPATPAMSFRDRIALERQRDGDGQSPG